MCFCYFFRFGTNSIHLLSRIILRIYGFYLLNFLRIKQNHTFASCPQKIFSPFFIIPLVVRPIFFYTLSKEDAMEIVMHQIELLSISYSALESLLSLAYISGLLRQLTTLRETIGKGALYMYKYLIVTLSVLALICLVRFLFISRFIYTLVASLTLASIAFGMSLYINHKDYLASSHNV